MDHPFASGKEFSLDEKEAWSTIAPLAGMVVEVDMLKTNRIVNAVVECWAAFFIKGVSNELDGSYVLEVNYLECEEEEEHAALTLLFKSGARHIHLCLGVPCVVVGSLEAIHATAIRLWAAEDFDAEYVEKHAWKTLKLWQKELAAAAAAPKRMARAPAKPKTEPKKTRKKDEEAEKPKPKRGKGLDEATKAKLQEKLKKVRELRSAGGGAEKSPVAEIPDSEEDGDDGSGRESTGYSPTPPLNTGSMLEGSGRKKRRSKEKVPSAKDGTLALYRGTRGTSTQGLTGQLWRRLSLSKTCGRRARRKQRRRAVRPKR